MKRFVAIILSFVLFGMANIQACPSCYGNAHSSRIDGMNAAIMTMVGITGFVLSGMSTVAYVIWRRTKLFNQNERNTIHLN